MMSMDECAYCLCPVDDDSESRLCDRCGTKHHRECWEINGGCSSKTCTSGRTRLDVDVSGQARERIVLSKESVESAAPSKPRTSNPCFRCGAQVPEGELYCERCIPEPAETPDAQNLWPLIVMLGAMAAALAWLITILMIGSSGGK